jgi:hypothetical protein
VSALRLAEALTRAICAAAVRLLGHQDINSVIYDTMIDNVRFVSDSAELIVRVWHNFVDICARVGVTMGEVTPPSCTNGQTGYVFLGLSFRQLCGVTATLPRVAPSHITNIPYLVPDCLAVTCITSRSWGRRRRCLRFSRRIRIGP